MGVRTSIDDDYWNARSIILAQETRINSCLTLAPIVLFLTDHMFFLFSRYRNAGSARKYGSSDMVFLWETSGLGVADCSGHIQGAPKHWRHETYWMMIAHLLTYFGFLFKLLASYLSAHRKNSVRYIQKIHDDRWCWQMTRFFTSPTTISRAHKSMCHFIWLKCLSEILLYKHRTRIPR